MTATNNSYDVIVVGTGPAGSTAAHLLAAAGVRVALVDKATPPRYKTCGGGVIARARRVFATAITPVVERECRRVEINLLDAGLGVAGEPPHPIVSMPLRDRLDARLAEGAVAAGAELLAPCAVGAVRADAGGIALETACGPLVAALVVAADGATGRLAGPAGWRANPGAIPAVEDEITAAEPTLARFAGAARFDFGPAPHGHARGFPKEAILPDLAVARTAATILYDHPRAQAALFRRVGREVAEALTDVMCGRESYREALPRFLSSALRSSSVGS